MHYNLFLISASHAKLVEFNSTFVMNIFNMIVLFAVLRHFLFKPISKVLEDRKAKIKSGFDRAKDLEEKAVVLNKELEEKIQQIKDEKLSIIDEARSNANEQAREIIKKAETEAKNIKTKMDKSIELEKEKARKELKSELTAMSVLIASKILKKDFEQNDNSEYLSEAIDKLGAVKWEN